MQSQTEHGSTLLMAPRSRLGAGSPSSAPYDVHSNPRSRKRSQMSHSVPSPARTVTGTGTAAPDGDVSWEVRAFAEDSASCSGQWPPRSYACSFCRREFRTAQALGGHMNVHRRERAQANTKASLRSPAQQTSVATTTPQQLNAVAGQQGGRWCLFSPMGVNPASVTSPEGRAFFYSSLAPGGALVALTSASGGGSPQFTSRSSPGPCPSQDNNSNKKETSTEKDMFTPSPMSSPNSQGSGSSSSSAITSQGGGGTLYRSTSSGSDDSASFVQKLQMGAFLPYQSSPFPHEGALVTQELIQLRPQHHNSALFPKSMVIRGRSDDVDLELRLGPA